MKFEVSFFSNKHDNLPKQGRLSWEELCDEIRKPVVRAAKDGPLFSSATFNGKRAKVNVEELSMLMLDLDHNVALDSIKEQLIALKCKYAVYSTHSHLRKTKSNPNAEPRFRVIIPLAEPIPAERFSALWHFAQKRTGLPIDEAAKDESRMFYKPAIATADARYEFYVQDGRLFNWKKLRFDVRSRRQIKSKCSEETIGDGRRNRVLFKIAKNFSEQGLALENVEDALIKINDDRCVPPLDLSEVKTIARNAEKYPIELGREDDLDGEDKEKPNGAKNQSERVIQLVDAAGIGFFNTGEGETFATIPMQSHFENHYLNSKFFRNWISHRYWEAEGKVPKSQPLQDALNALNGRAKFDSPTCESFVRLAESDEKIYLDLGNETWQVVEISTSGWRIIEGFDSPVKFRRPKGIAALPTPTKGGDPMEIKSYINVVPEHFPLVLIWLIACLRPDKPFPVLIVNGEQGSAKSTTSRVLRRLIDPNKAELRTPPGDARDLMIAATNGWLLAFDNVAKIQDWQSDAFCCLSTGAGFSTRTLYENNEESLFCAKRPILLNGITELATRADLLDRTLLINCPTISKSERRDEETIWHEFDRAQPILLGAILTALSSTIQRLPEVRLTELERMADFEKFGVAAEAALGMAQGTFQRAYSTNRRDASEVAIDSSTTAMIVIAFIGTRNNWMGTATQLLTELKRFAEAHNNLGIRPDDLPKKANLLSGELKRTAPNLRASGIEFTRKKSGGRTITLEKIVKSASESSESSESSAHSTFAGLESDDTAPTGNEMGDAAVLRHFHKPYQTNDLDDMDGADDVLPPFHEMERSEIKTRVDDSLSDTAKTVLPVQVLGHANGKPYVKCKCGKPTYLGQACPFCGREVLGVLIAQYS